MYDNFDLDEPEFRASQEELEKMLFLALEKVLPKYLTKHGLFVDPNIASKEPKWVSLSDLCKELKISRQSIYNWRKTEFLKSMIDFHVKKSGNKTLYELVGFRAMLENNGKYFSKGRDYEYKENLKPEWYQEAKKKSKIRFKLMYQEPLSPDEQDFLEKHPDLENDSFL